MQRKGAREYDRKRSKAVYADMRKECLKGKEYIHFIDKWNEYIKYLNNNLNI